jgi:light-regulated signal transduction histidine kinase (bacteriophytochrome)
MLLPPEHRHDLDQTFMLLRAGGRVRSYDGIRRRQDGSNVDVSISMAAIRDGQGNLVGAAKIIRDITQQKVTEASLAAARDAAEAAAQAFEAFSYSVAHDLRAPLRAIDGFSRILSAEYMHLLDESGQDYLSRICDSSLRMARLIDSLLTLARVTHQDLASHEVDLSAIAVNTLDRLQREAPDREVIQVIQADLRAHGDPVLLATTLENLLGNAWKFTAGRAGARIEFGRDTTGYFVRDNGAGFDMAYAAKLFGVFQRLHSPDEFAGTGIGLATVERIVQRHGGRIWAEGAVDAGATFHFTLAEGTP